MAKLRIISNYHKRDIIYGWELTEDERKEFDWLDDCDTLDWDTAEFFRYKGWVYCLSDMMRVGYPFGNAPSEFRGWDGYENHIFFSGILVKYPREDWGGIDSEHVIVATFYAMSEWED